MSLDTQGVEQREGGPPKLIPVGPISGFGSQRIFALPKSEAQMHGRCLRILTAMEVAEP